MRPKNNKMTLILAIILTIIALPLAILSTYGHILYGKADTEPSCDIKLAGGACYTCENTTGYCNYAYNYVNDNKYNLNYYQGNNNYLTFSSDYIFLMDSPTTFNRDRTTEYPNTIVYNITNGSKITITGLNNYGLGFQNDYYIGITANGKYTIYTINQIIKKNFEEEYDFIGAANKVVNGKLDSTKFAALKNNEWQLIDPNGKVLTTTFSNPIYDYSNKAIALYKNNTYYLSDYQGNNLLNMYFESVFFYKDILLLINNGILYIYDSNTDTVLSSSIKIRNAQELIVDEGDDYIDLTINGIKNTRVFYDGRITSLLENNNN